MVVDWSHTHLDCEADLSHLRKVRKSLTTHRRRPWYGGGVPHGFIERITRLMRLRGGHFFEDHVVRNERLVSLTDDAYEDAMNEVHG